MSQQPTSDAQAAADKFNAEFQKFRGSADYQNAIRIEGESREIPFLGLPEILTISSRRIVLRQMSLRDLCVLYQIESPLIMRSFIDGIRKPIPFVPERVTPECAAEHLLITPADVAAFLWCQSVRFRPVTGNAISRLYARARRWWFYCRASRLHYGEACEQIRGYLERAMWDAPQATSGTPRSNTVGWVASIVYFVSREMLMPPREVMEMPLACLFQFERQIIAEHSKNGRLGLPSRADSLQAKWLESWRREHSQN